VHGENKVKGDTLGEVIRRIGRSVGLQSDLALADAQLLERFVKRRDEPAFAALVVRHGPMVLGVCRRLVRDAQEAEDAFQATFLVLARKAAVIRRQPLLASWLYGVAYRVAVRLRGQTMRRRMREQPDADMTALAVAEAGPYSDVRPLVHEEVGRLPDKYRSAVVLCYLEGKTNEEAALQLRWPVGSVKSRLSRARELLRTRLTRRGVTLSAGLLTTALVVNKASASPALADATIRGAALYAAGDAAAGGLISARAVGLSYGVLRTMILTKAKFVIALALSLAMLGGAGGLAYRSLAAGADDARKTAPAKTASRDGRRPEADTDAEKIQGTWLVVSAEQGGNEAPAEAIKDFTVVISADKIAFKPKGENNQFSYKLDPKKNPKVIEIATPLDSPAKGKALHGLYALDGDRLKLCLQNGSGAEPTEFATTSDSGLRLLTLKREPADKEKPKEEKPKEGESKTDAEAIQGVWHVTALETEGKERDDAGAKQIKTQEWTITKDRIVIKTAVPGAGDHKVGCSYMIDPTKTPKTIDVTMEYGDDTVKAERKVRAIYSLKGDVLKVCKGMTAAEIKHDDQDVGRRPRVFDPRDLTADGGRPTELATKEGSRSTLITLKREPVGKDKPKDDQEAIQGTWQWIDWYVGNPQGADQPSPASESVTWVIKADKISVLNGSKKKVSSVSYKLDPTKNPKEIDLILLDVPEDFKGKLECCTYTLEGDILRICSSSEREGVRPTEVATNKQGTTTLRRFKRMPLDEDKPKDECAWGKAVKGLQAGLCIRPAEKDSYAVGETATFVVKVRNGSDKPVEFRYVAPIPIGNDVDQLVSPSVLDADGNRVTMSGPAFSGGGGQGYGKKTLGVDEEIEFALPTLLIAPVAESRVTEKPMAHVKPGTYKVYYNVYYVNPDDTGNYLTTGQVEIAVKAAK
jgi:RNA polymerase sigma factor (sigma-70 family)